MGYLRMGLMGMGQQEPGWGFTRMKLGCSRKVKIEGYHDSRKVFPLSQALSPKAALSDHTRAPVPEETKVTRKGWGFRLQLGIPFTFRESLEDKMLFDFPLLGRKKDGGCLEKRQRDSSLSPCRTPQF